MISMNVACSVLLVAALLSLVNGFSISQGASKIACRSRGVNLYMGRAAAVRAATKSRTDGAKAKNNSRYAKKIVMAVKAGGGTDPEKNRQLGQVIAEAKVNNVPKDVITRNIEKGNAAATVDFKSSIFEFYGHGGVGFLVNVLTDNDNRAASEVNLVAKKNILKSAAMNSVNFKFDKKARLDLQTTIDEDTLMEVCLEQGVDDYDLRNVVDGNPLNPQEEGKVSIYVEMKDMAVIRDSLKAMNFVLETSLAAVPKEGTVSLNDEDFQANMEAIDRFLDLDDVDSVEHNIDMTDDEA